MAPVGIEETIVIQFTIVWINVVKYESVIAVVWIVLSENFIPPSNTFKLNASVSFDLILKPDLFVVLQFVNVKAPSESGNEFANNITLSFAFAIGL